MLNDCLTLCVNQLVRYAFFVMREQVQRLWMHAECKSAKYVDNKKVNFGVSVKAFRDFFVKDHHAYSIVK
jgi:hypothetical protein